ncbi:hypothetical protein, partial [Mesorhizobium japonicum]|uniref:hypothetical protein n=1 Tax=Mesorhizobium japonicum TaxID=2066070 RepID=UPI003B5BD060
SMCDAFIDEHAAHFALYKAIRKAISARAWDAAELVNKYLRWVTARTMLVQGIGWEVIARELGVKKQATVEKYVNLADQAERE